MEPYAVVLSSKIPMTSANCFRSRSVFVVLAILLWVASAASAADFACSASVPATPTLRAEGLTELVGDIVLKCTGGTPTPSGQTIPAASLTIILNTAVSSRLMGNSAVNSEALLLIDEPGSQSNPTQSICNAVGTGCPVTGTSTSAGNAGPEPFNGSSGRPNIFQGTVSGSSVTFSGVPIDPPGNGTRVYRFTNIRANANGIAVGPGGGPGAIIAAI